jgi:glycosyltransferase involved in cell wall biosynthesis
MMDKGSPRGEAGVNPLRVALFSGNYNYTRDGANRALNRLVAHLIAQGTAVRIYSPTIKKPAFEGTGDIVSVPSIPIPGRKEFRLALGLPRHVGRDIRLFKPDIIHVSAPDWLGTSAQYLGQALGVPVIASFHTRFEAYFDYYGLGWLRRWAWKKQSEFYRRCQLVLAPNEPMRRHILAMGVADSRVKIWGRGVDPLEFSPLLRSVAWRRIHGFRDDEAIVLFFGRLVLEKGIADFIETIKRLETAGTPHRILVVGAGPGETVLRNSLPSAVFTGELHGEELGRAVASADILLNPSRSEAFGNVNLEAMASGLAVVSADVGSARALIDHGHDGLLCADGPEAFARSVRRLLLNSVERGRLSQAAVETSKNYLWQDALKKVDQAYEELRNASNKVNPS